MKTFADVSCHAAMVADRTRVLAYRDAIRAVVRPGDVVADLGTGTGLLAACCLQAGAKRVHCVDRLPVIQLAKELLDSHGWADRAVLHETTFDEVDLGEPVDVMVSEVLGSLGPGESSFASLTRLRDQFLRRGGRLVPAELRVEVAPVTDPDFSQFLSFDVACELGLDYDAAVRLAVNQRHGHRVGPDSLLGPPETLHQIDFATVTANQADDLDSTVVLAVDQEGELHGIVGWFMADLTEDVILSNRPGGSSTSWHHAFFPIAEPLTVVDGDLIEFSLRMDFAGGDHFVFRWRTVVRRRGEEVAAFAQDTLTGQLFSGHQLRVAAGEVPASPTKEGRLARFVLARADGEASDAEIVRDYASLVGAAPEDVQNDVERMLRRSRLLGDLT